MELVKRRITYCLYLTSEQHQLMLEFLRLHCELYNAAVQERRDAWTLRGISSTKADQEKQLVAIKEARPELIPLGGHALQETLRRVDLAFQAFFRRVKAGETPGFPRFKSWKRFSGWTYKSTSSWRFFPGEKKHGVLELDGIGRLRMRGEPRQLGEIKTLTISHKRGRWYASIVIACMPEREHRTAGIGFDWGIERLLTFDDGTGVENPRFLKKSERKLKALGRAASRKKRGSKNRKKAVAKLGQQHERIASLREDFLHQQSAELVGRAALLATKKLAVANMTRSARGTVEAPGKNVRQKAGLNKSILDGAPAAFLGMVRYKAAEAGIALVEAPTRMIKPSQTCPACGRQQKKTLAERVHRCACGCVLPRDQASAQVCLHYALSLSEPGIGPGVEGASPPAKHETATEYAPAYLGER
ncbi:MAG: transposase [Candidatus Schekmanbacteria bacterium]|nr:transposase [Candidatus Schekmanbacteria bacterium]